MASSLSFNGSCNESLYQEFPCYEDEEPQPQQQTQTKRQRTPTELYKLPIDQNDSREEVQEHIKMMASIMDMKLGLEKLRLEIAAAEVREATERRREELRDMQIRHRKETALEKKRKF